VNVSATNLFSVGELSPTALLTIPLGTVAGVDYSINLDPFQEGTAITTWIAKLLELLTFSKKIAAMFIFVGLFWVMYSHVEQYSKDVVVMSDRIVHLPTVGASNLVGRAAFGMFMVNVVTAIIGVLPWAAFAVMALIFNSAPASAAPNLDITTEVNASFTGAMKEVFLRYFKMIAYGIPFAEMLSAFVQWAAFRFYMPWLYGLVITYMHTHALLVIGRCILPFLFVVGASGAHLELHNLTGTNLVWTNAQRRVEFPPGETRINIEAGWYMEADGSEVPLPDTENLQVMRVSKDETGLLVLDNAFATSPADSFWYGFAAGLSIFGALAWVSVIKAGVGVGLRNNVYVRE
jgi:hypothetical protein